MILIRVVRCMMPGRGWGGWGTPPWEVKVELETQRSDILSEAESPPLGPLWVFPGCRWLWKVTKQQDQLPLRSSRKD